MEKIKYGMIIFFSITIVIFSILDLTVRSKYNISMKDIVVVGAIGANGVGSIDATLYELRDITDEFDTNIEVIDEFDNCLWCDRYILAVVEIENTFDFEYKFHPYAINLIYYSDGTAIPPEINKYVYTPYQSKYYSNAKFTNFDITIQPGEKIKIYSVFRAGEKFYKSDLKILGDSFELKDGMLVRDLVLDELKVGSKFKVLE